MDVQREITDLAVANLRVALPDGQEPVPLTAGEDPKLDTYVLYQQGRVALDRPQTPESLQLAIGYFEQALAIDPGFSAAHAEICRAYVEYFESTHDPAGIESAESACAAAVNANPNLDVVYTALGMLRASTSKNFDAEEAFNRALDINPRNVRAMQGLAIVYQQRLKFDDAERLLIRAIDLQPGNWRSIADLGLLYFSTGRYVEAAHEFRKVVFLDPDNWIGYGNLGSALMMTGQFAAALDPLTESLRIHKDSQYLSNLGIIYYYLGEYDRAAEMHREAIDMMPDASFLWVNLGDALRFSSQSGAAREAYENAIEKAATILAIDPHDPISLLMQAWSLASIGEIEAAKTSIETALRVAPEDPYAHYYDGLLKIELEETVEAIDALEVAVDLGYPVAMLKADPLLAGLRAENRFGVLISED
jgi:serine/threonine-protein kinase